MKIKDDALKVLEQKAIESVSDNKPVITKEIYDKNIRRKNGWNTKNERKIDFNNLTYSFKGLYLWSH